MIQKNDVMSLRFDKILLQLLFPCFIASYYTNKESDNSSLKQNDETGKSYTSGENLPDDLLLYEEEEDEGDLYDLYRYDRGGDFISALSVIPEATNTTCSTTTFCSSDINSKPSHDGVITRKIVTSASSWTLSGVDKDDRMTTTSVDERDDTSITLRELKRCKSSAFIHKSDSASSKPTIFYQEVHNDDIRTQFSCSSIERKSKSDHASLVLGIGYGEEMTVSTPNVLYDSRSASSCQRWECSSERVSSNLVHNFLYHESSSTVSSTICEKNSFEKLLRSSDSGSTIKSNRSTKIQSFSYPIKSSKYCKSKSVTDVDSLHDNLSVSTLRKYEDRSKRSPSIVSDDNPLGSGNIDSNENPLQYSHSYRDQSSESKPEVGDNSTSDDSGITCNVGQKDNSERPIWRSISGITNKSSGCSIKNRSKT